MNKQFKCYTLCITFFLLYPILGYAQLQEGMSDRYIRVAEIGELVDSVHVWGDVTDAGRYLVPVGTKLPDLISYSFGYEEMRSGGGGDNDFSKTMIEIKVSRYNKEKKLVNVALFRYRYHDPEPVEMFEFDLQNNDIITLHVRRKPAFGDYVGVIAPVVSVIATSMLLIQNLRGD